MRIRPSYGSQATPPRHPESRSQIVRELPARSSPFEWADRGVRVTTISPGYIGTELLRFDALAPLREEWEGLTPQRRVASPDELKGIATYLASDASSYATAAGFIVDGGYTAA